ncbi:cupin domain-containing protein [Sphingomonas sp. MMSM20]|uniref:cupin domain-containing protein n=1 Tax=Sphingomonas lycopersici TaxID=2951807 RepID=UPI002237E39A|nr:cupin domain-containing protein [Sphingomonas lycopersici]MCW6529094.1 cupin domain-containing protein [Sphingomonas lycopersici]
MGFRRWSAAMMICAASVGTAQTAPPAGAPANAPRPAFAPPPPMRVWAPKKTPYADYKAPNRPWWKLSDVLALHKGEKSWSQPIVRNKDVVADWHQIAPGQATPQLAYSDNRTGIIVWDGEITVTLAGQPPFVARKGFEIDIPFRVPFTLQTVGDRPALYFEIHAASDMPLYPVETTRSRPKPVDGFVYEERLAVGPPGQFDAMNRPYLDYFKEVVAGGARAGAFIAAQHMFVNNIRGRAVPTPPASNLGHYHIGYDEFWFVMEGNVDLQVEGVPTFTASPGDVISAAQGRWHRASFGGPEGQMGTRVAVNPYPAGLHGYTVESGGRQ